MKLCFSLVITIFCYSASAQLTADDVRERINTLYGVSHFNSMNQIRSRSRNATAGNNLFLVNRKKSINQLKQLNEDLFNIEYGRYRYLKEDEIDLAEISLEIAKKSNPTLNKDEYLKKINAIVFRVKEVTGGKTDPDFRIRALNTVFFKEYKFDYDLTDKNVVKRKNRFIDGLLDTKKGSCVTLPLLYVVVAQKLGYPIYPTVVPTHFLLRYEDKSLANKNIEVTGYGQFISDEKYIKDFNVGKKGLEKGAYLRNLTYKEYVGELLGLLSVQQYENNQISKALKVMRVGLDLRHGSPEMHFTRGKMIHESIKKIKNRFPANEKLNTFVERLKKEEVYHYIKASEYGHWIIDKDKSKGINGFKNGRLAEWKLY